MILSNPDVPLLIFTISSASSKNEPKSTFKPAVKCDFCEKSYGTFQELQGHIERIHDGQRNKKCNICCKSFITTSEVNQHIKNVHYQKK